MAGSKRRNTLNAKLRKLVQQLGEAIHETVSESEHIAGVVQDIRKQGFDVLLMLEATIGLNELEQQPEAMLEPSRRRPGGRPRGQSIFFPGPAFSPIAPYRHPGRRTPRLSPPFSCSPNVLTPSYASIC